MAASSKWVEGIGAETPVEEAARKSLQPRLTVVSHLLPVAAHLASHDIEHVHRLRVATRRATAALKLYRECVPPRQYRWMKKRLRKIRRAAGDARDLDVLSERLMHEYGERVAPVIECIARDRAAVQPAIVRVAERCRSKDRLVRKTAAVLHSIRLPRIVGEADESREFRAWAASRFGEIAESFVAAMPTESSSPAELHQFRIRAKALRYAIELVAPAFDPQLRKSLYPLVEELQERLGTVQDHVAAAARCEAWAARTHDEALQETLRELAEAENRGLSDAIHGFHAWWTDDRIAEVHRLIATATVTHELPAEPSELRQT